MLTYVPPHDVVHGRDDMDIQKSGFLYKQTNGSLRKWKEYYFCLGRLSLICYRKDTDVKHGKEPKFKIELSDIEEVEHTFKKMKATKQLIIVMDQGAVYLRSEELADAKDWIKKLRDSIAICKQRREMLAELQRASFKMAVEQNLRQKYLQSNPKKSVEEMPRVTYLKRIELKSPADLKDNQVNTLPPLTPDKRCISIDGNIISRRDNVVCFKRTESMTGRDWRNRHHKTIYKNLNKDSLRKALLKKNASKIHLDKPSMEGGSPHGSMIITTNLSFQENENNEDKFPVKAYSSLEGLNRWNEKESMTPRNDMIRGDFNNRISRIDKSVYQNPIQSDEKELRYSPKYSASNLFKNQAMGGIGNGRINEYTRNRSEEKVKNKLPTRSFSVHTYDYNTLNKQYNKTGESVSLKYVNNHFSRNSPAYASYNPPQSSNFHRHHVAYRSLNTYVRPAALHTGVIQRQLNTITEQESSSQVNLNEDMDNQNDNISLYNRGYPCKDSIFVENFAIPRSKVSRSCSANEATYTLSNNLELNCKKEDENNMLLENEITLMNKLPSLRNTQINRSSTFVHQSQYHLPRVGQFRNCNDFNLNCRTNVSDDYYHNLHQTMWKRVY